MSYSQKLNKYNLKLKGASDENRISLYNQKIQYYNNMVKKGGNKVKDIQEKVGEVEKKLGENINEIELDKKSLSKLEEISEVLSTTFERKVKEIMKLGKDLTDEKQLSENIYSTAIKGLSDISNKADSFKAPDMSSIKGMETVNKFVDNIEKIAIDSFVADWNSANNEQRVTLKKELDTYRSDIKQIIEQKINGVAQVEQPQPQPQVEQPQVEQPQVEQPQVEQPQVEQPQVEQPQVEQQLQQQLQQQLEQQQLGQQVEQKEEQKGGKKKAKKGSNKKSKKGSNKRKN